MNKTSIQYLDYTWNPIAMRCTPVSAGCANCWHLVMADRLAVNPNIDKDRRNAYADKRAPMLAWNQIRGGPHKLRTPSVIGVQFMGDLWHLSVSLDLRARVFGLMALCLYHTFLMLTKRPQHMLAGLNTKTFRREVEAYYLTTVLNHSMNLPREVEWPLPNVWLGVTVEDQATADERIPLLLQMPATHRWVSVEPMLGPVNLDEYFGWCEPVPPYSRWENTVDWVVAGCESGPRRRPADIDWFRSLRNQCQAAGTPYFLKQMEIDGKVVHMPELDGVIWDQMPVREPNAG